MGDTYWPDTVARQAAVLRDQATTIETLRAVLRDEYAGHEAYIDNVPCDAGNFDGGNSRDCEHCQHQRRLEVLQRYLA